MNCPNKLVWVQLRVLSLKKMGTLRSKGGIGSGSGSGNENVNGSGEPLPKGPMDKFSISQPI